MAQELTNFPSVTKHLTIHPYKSMQKIWLIISREYLTRVRKKSFVIMSILGPLLIVAFYGVVIWSAMSSSGEEKTVLVIDESRKIGKHLEDDKGLIFLQTEAGALPLDSAISQFNKSNYDAILFIPDFKIQNPEGFKVYIKKSLSASTDSYIRRNIEKEVEQMRLQNAGIDPAILKDSKIRISLDTKVIDKDGVEKNSNAKITSVIGVAAGFVIYMFIFLYGVQVMRGVIEEKTNRIIEVVISSVKPFQLMMGKIIGIAGVGLTQIMIWVVLGSIGPLIMLGFVEIPPEALKVFQAFEGVNFPLIICSFFFYFLFGYLMYAALFGAIGAAVDSETDTQQFMLPITMPLVLSIALSGVIITNPDGPLAFWASMFPLTSPVVMMIRLPFIGFSWELVLSMTILVISFIGCTWMGAKIYRVGILMYGKKASYKEMAKWMFYEG
ncbi:MAG: ABC-2 type transport system permease protein [Flammeovirgaceae bacterium]|jgi:ABC-2 type transport system permease protein